MPAVTPLRTGIINALVTTFQGIDGTGDYNNDLSTKVSQYRTREETYQASEIPGVNVRALGQGEPDINLKDANGTQLNPLEVEVDIIANTAAQYHTVLVDLLTSIRADQTLGGLVIMTLFLGDALEFAQEDKAFKGGTARFRIIHRTAWLRI